MANEIKIGDVLTTLLKEKHITIRQLSKDSGVPASTISEWTSGRSPKNVLHAKKVAKALGISFHYLLFGEDDAQDPIQKILKEDLFQGTFEISIKRVKIK